MTPEQEKRIEEIVLYANNLPPHKSRQKDYFKFLLGCLDELKEASCDDQEKIDHLAHNVLAIQDENAELKAELERLKEAPMVIHEDDYKEYLNLKAENTRLAAEVKTLTKVISESIGWLRNVENSNSRYVSFGAEGIRLQFEAALASKEGG